MKIIYVWHWIVSLILPGDSISIIQFESTLCDVHPGILDSKEVAWSGSHKCSTKIEYERKIMGA